MNRIKELRIKSGLTMRDTAKALDLPYTTYINYEKGYREPNSEALIQIANYFGVTVDFLIGNSSLAGDNSGNFDAVDILTLSPISQLKRKKVPLLGDIACGEPIYAEESLGDFIWANEDIDADFCLTCHGDSMTGARINDGDLVFIKKQDMVDNGQIAAVIIENEATLKRVYYYPEQGKLVLGAENPKYQPFVYVGEELNQIRILGRAVAFQSYIR